MSNEVITSSAAPTTVAKPAEAVQHGTPNFSLPAMPAGVKSPAELLAKHNGKAPTFSYADLMGAIKDNQPTYPNVMQSLNDEQPQSPTYQNAPIQLDNTPQPENGNQEVEQSNSYEFPKNLEDIKPLLESAGKEMGLTEEGFKKFTEFCEASEAHNDKMLKTLISKMQARDQKAAKELWGKQVGAVAREVQDIIETTIPKVTSWSSKQVKQLINAYGLASNPIIGELILALGRAYKERPYIGSPSRTAGIGSGVDPNAVQNLKKNPEYINLIRSGIPFNLNKASDMLHQAFIKSGIKYD